MNAAIQVTRAVCPHDCPDTCAMRVTVENGKAIKVTGDPDHPPTQGVLCTKVSRYADRVHHPDRLTVPLKRIGAKGEGHFVPISWDEAFDEIGRRLGEIAARAPEAIVPYSYAGTMGLVQGRASPSGSSTNWAPRGSSARSARRPVLQGYGTHMVAVSVCISSISRKAN